MKPEAAEVDTRLTFTPPFNLVASNSRINALNVDTTYGSDASLVLLRKNVFQEISKLRQEIAKRLKGKYTNPFNCADYLISEALGLSERVMLYDGSEALVKRPAASDAELKADIPDFNRMFSKVFLAIEKAMIVDPMKDPLSRHLAFRMGIFHRDGIGTAVSEMGAFEWFSVSAAEKYAPAQINLSSCYHRGSGVARSDTKAFIECQKAALNGFPLAFYNLARFYENGIGVRKNLKEACKYYRHAALSGIDQAHYYFGLCHEEGKGTLKDVTKAILAFARGVAVGDRNAIERFQKPFEINHIIIDEYEIVAPASALSGAEIIEIINALDSSDETRALLLDPWIANVIAISKENLSINDLRLINQSLMAITNDEKCEIITHRVIANCVREKVVGFLVDSGVAMTSQDVKEFSDLRADLGFACTVEPYKASALEPLADYLEIFPHREEGGKFFVEISAENLSKLPQESVVTLSTVPQPNILDAVKRIKALSAIYPAIGIEIEVLQMALRGDASHPSDDQINFYIAEVLGLSEEFSLANGNKVWSDYSSLKGASFSTAIPENFKNSFAAVVKKIEEVVASEPFNNALLHHLSFRLGLLYEAGIGVEADNVKSENFIDQAVRAGYAPAENFLAKKFKTTNPPLFFQFINRAYEKGFLPAQPGMASCIMNGIPGIIEGNPRVGFDLLFDAVQKGCLEAQTDVSLMYNYGVVVMQNKSRAFQYCMSSARQGDPIAMLEVANAYRDGGAVCRDVAQEVLWICRAIANDNSFAVDCIRRPFELDPLLTAEGGVISFPIGSLSCGEIIEIIKGADSYEESVQILLDPTSRLIGRLVEVSKESLRPEELVRINQELMRVTEDHALAFESHKIIARCAEEKITDFLMTDGFLESADQIEFLEQKAGLQFFCKVKMPKEKDSKFIGKSRLTLYSTTRDAESCESKWAKRVLGAFPEVHEEDNYMIISVSAEILKTLYSAPLAALVPSGVVRGGGAAAGAAAFLDAAARVR